MLKMISFKDVETVIISGREYLPKVVQNYVGI